MPVYIYIANWFTVGKVKRLLYAMERSGVGERGWWWSSHRWTFNISGEKAKEAHDRLCAVYPAFQSLTV